jgi:ABC-type transport system substrate-binding protein
MLTFAGLLLIFHAAPEAFNRLCDALETSTDMARRPAIFHRMLEIIEREDPGYTVLHRLVTFISKRKDIAWKVSPTQVMDFRAGNFHLVKWVEHRVNATWVYRSFRFRG